MSDLRTWWTLYPFTRTSIDEQPRQYPGLGHERADYGCGCRRTRDRIDLCRYHEGMEKGADLQLVDESRRVR